MAEPRASDARLDMPPEGAPPAASSHENESGRTGDSSQKLGCWCKVYLVILVFVALPIIPGALLIWCLHALLAKLKGSKGKNESSPKPAVPPGLCSRWCSFISSAAVALLFLVALTIWCPFWLLSMLLCIEGVSSPRKVAENLKPNHSGNENDLNKQLGKIDGLVNEGVAAARWRLRILLLLFLLQMDVIFFPFLYTIFVMGSALVIWIAMLPLVVYHLISSLGQFISNKRKETAVAYYVDGLRRSGSWFIVCVYILLIGEFCVWYGVSKKVHHIGTSLAISLLVGASLALVKNWLILLWESHTIFRRCTTTKISEVGEQLYFLGLVYGFRFDLFSPDQADNINNSAPDNDKKELSNYVKKQMAECFIKMAKIFSRKDITNGRIPKSISNVWEKFLARGSDYITKESMKEKLKAAMKEKLKAVKSSDKERVEENLQDNKLEKDINDFFEKLRDEDKKRKNADALKDKESKKTDKLKGKETKDKEPKNADESKSINEPEERMFEGQDLTSTDEISYETFKQWMNKAFINCVSFGYTLGDTQRAKNKLDNIITVFLVIVAILCFLFYAGIASTKLLVTLGTSIATAAFIFGDMLKAFFEGIIFVFVMQQFNVGDLCIIDNTQLEVNSIDVLKTTFHRIDNKEEVLYPNKVLAGKTISNLKWQLNNEDYVELSLRPPVGIRTLEKRIEGFFDEYSHEFEKPRVLTKEIGEFIKIAIHFKHIIQDDTHVLYCKKKKEQRSKLLREVLDHIETKESSSTNNTVESSGQKTREIASSSTKKYD